MESFTDEDSFIQINILPGAYEIDNLTNEIIRIIIDESRFTEGNYPSTVKPKFSKLGSKLEISLKGLIISFMFDDSIRDLLGFNAVILYEEYNLSPNCVDIISFNNTFIETVITRDKIFKGKQIGTISNYAIDVDPGCIFFQNIRGGFQWFKIESKDIISSICFKIRNENGRLVSFNVQSVTFRLSIKEI